MVLESQISIDSNGLATRGRIETSGSNYTIKRVSGDLLMLLAYVCVVMHFWLLHVLACALLCIMYLLLMHFAHAFLLMHFRLCIFAYAFLLMHFCVCIFA